MKFQHVPGPWPAGEPDPQPELLAGFEELGFRVLGAGIRVLPTDAQVSRLAGGYAGPDRDAFLEHALRPFQVLAAPDGTAFVRLAWFWSGRFAEVLTVLTDGRLIATTSDWGIDPAWPRQTRRWYAATTDRLREQKLWSSPSSSAKIVNGSASDVFSAHRAQLVRLRGAGEAPHGHQQLSDAVAVYDAVQASRTRSAGRSSLLAALIAFLVALTSITVVNIRLQPGFVGEVLVLLGGFAVALVVQKQVWLRARHWGWLRPRFRAPVPQAAAS